MMEQAAAATDHHRDRDRDRERDDDEDGNNSKKRKVSNHEDESNSKKMKMKTNKEESSSKKRKASEDGDEGDSKKLKAAEMTNEVGGVLVPNHVMNEIFFHLSLRSVFRFRSASKGWCSDLSDPYFLQQYALRFHTQRQDDLEPPGLLICPTNKNHPAYCNLPQNQEQPHVSPLKLHLDNILPAFKISFPTSSVIGSCNGLLLYHLTHMNEKAILYKVYNPMINQHKEIPELDFSQFFEKPKEAVQREQPYLIFDPSRSPSYKVLAIYHEPPFTHFQIHVYSSETATWRYIATIPHDAKHNIHWVSVMFNGVFYCLRDNDAICFDAENDTVSYLQLPQKPAEDWEREVFYVGECGGRLRLIQEYDHDHWFPFTCSIMEMERVLGEPTIWIERFRVNLDAGYDHFNQQTLNPVGIEVMHLYETEEGDEALLLNINHQRLVSFNLTTSTFGAELAIPYFENYSGLIACPFSPTLCPL